ncbi:MAG: hypothetical protein IJX74_02005 [Clostridia bacterium]|nr:hypothetical protein [Clostridia bacterium]
MQYYGYLKRLLLKCIDAKGKYIRGAEGCDYYITSEEGAVYLLFEHSNGREDWKNNLDFPIRPYKNMDEVWYCHKGFLKPWKANRDDIEAHVSDELRRRADVKNIICVGYSHGAALAVFATEDMEYLYGGKYAVSGYGFGAPRVVWGRPPDGVSRRLQGYTVIRNIPDLVTHLPPKLLGFCDVGNMTELGKRGTYNCIEAHKYPSYIAELDKLINKKAKVWRYGY